MTDTEPHKYTVTPKPRIEDGKEFCFKPFEKKTKGIYGGLFRQPLPTKKK